jgi:membrane protease YdiL (CAAX protease family)
VQKRGVAVLAWVVIAFTILTIYGLRHLEKPTAGEAGKEDTVGLVMMEFQSRYLVGTAPIIRWMDQKAMPRPQPADGKRPPPTANEMQLYTQAKTLNRGTVGQRQRFVVLAGELGGPDEARKQLRALDETLEKNAIELTADQARVRKLLADLYVSYSVGEFEVPEVTPGDREFLEVHLGWFGKLALAPPECPDPSLRKSAMAPAARVAVATFGVASALVAGLIASVVFLIVAIVMAVRGLIPRPTVGPTGNGGIYAETFAMWMVGFFVMQVGLGNLEASEWIPLPPMTLPIAAFFLSLTALAWPVLRGIPWSTVRLEIGLNFGKGLFVEPWAGLGTYLAAGPVFFVGFLITILVLFLQGALQPSDGTDDFGGTGGPAHPIVGAFKDAGWGEIAILFIAASVAAPIVEETMFRGVLLRHLRESTWRMGRFASFLASALLSSFVFAVVHPQGIIGVPALMGLAIGFCMAREWRGSLLPAMIMHGVHNGLLLVLMLIITR